MTERFVLRNVKRVNGEEIDIVIENNKIVQVTKAGAGEGGKVLDYSGTYVSSGWIDLHVHAFPEFDPYGDEVDEIGVKQGVTTIVDAGRRGADRIADLVKVESRQNEFICLLNISRIGLKRIDELSNMEWIDKEKVIEAVEKYKDVIVGLKARMSKSVVCDSGIEPAHVARSLSRETSLPIMVHISASSHRGSCTSLEKMM